jgi:TIR domain
MKVFISHSTSDGLTLAQKTAEIIGRAGHTPWLYEHDKTLGALVWREIADCIVNGSDIVLFLCTPESQDSWGQAQEAGYALNNRKKIIVIAVDNSIVPVELTARWYQRMPEPEYEKRIPDIILDLPRIAKRIQKLDPRIKASIT